MNIRINGIETEVIPGETILQAAKRAGVFIPTLCHHDVFDGQGKCRMCMVEVKKGNSTRLAAACTYPISSEIEVTTSTPAIEKIRRNIVMLLYKRAPDSEFMRELYHNYECPENSLSVNSGERCILCGLCIKACEELGANAISAVLRGTDKRIATPYDEPSSVCIGCASCAAVCPTGAISVTETSNQRTIWNKTFELMNCESCGRSFSTREQLAFTIAKIGGELPEYYLCESCRKKKYAHAIKKYTRS